MKINFAKIIKLATTFVMGLPALSESKITMQGVKNDVHLVTTAGTLSYRPDGVDSTLLCFKNFNIFSEPTAFRVYDLTSKDIYPDNYAELVRAGMLGKVKHCQVEAGKTMTFDNMALCFQQLAATDHISARKNDDEPLRRLVEKVDYTEECTGPAKPKEPTIVERKPTQNVAITSTPGADAFVATFNRRA